MRNCDTIDRCIACDNEKLLPLLSLGVQPLANSFKTAFDEPEEMFPLSTVYCDKCYHVQLTHKVNPDLLFKDYLYVSGTTKTHLKYFDWFANYTIERCPVTPVRVLDIGCNDGSQLDVYKALNVKTYGVVCGYFNDQDFRNGKTFDIITCQNAFAHNYDPLDFLDKVRKVMNKDSLLYITTSQANMILNNEFDTIYHEHISFYNIKSMNELCKRAGLNLIDVVKNPIHGTSYIFVISRFSKYPRNIENLIDLEESQGLYDVNTYKKYVRNCQKIIMGFNSKVCKLRNEGLTIVGYGAPAKGNTLMNASLVRPDFIIDENPLKQGLFTPGMSVPVYGLEALKTYEGVEKLCFIPLAWNFYDEIMKKIQSVRRDKEDIFVRYFPQVEVEDKSKQILHFRV
jgi:SAM-dependent methyltransferase